CILEDPAGIFEEIARNIRAAYEEGVIHADLSEFNVMLDGDRVVLIDWPQWVSPDHPNAMEILARDLENITKYFQRKYSLRVDPREVLEGILT
ncbi:MAG: serine/threonine protein phosphatase, partial [Methanolinea sp.]|nr:serine/threonine protein phosphatase [Methanolinea sp.]